MSRAEEWRSGWPLVPLTALGLTCAPITLPVYTIGVFVGPLQREFGWGRGEIQTAILFSTGLAVIAAPLAGEMVRRFGTRRTIVSGLVGIALACLLASRMQGVLWQLYAAYALMSLLGTGAGAVPWTSLIASHFAKARGLALGLALSGTGLCAILMPQIVTWAIAVDSWRFAYLVLAGFALVVVLPACLLVLPGFAKGTETASEAPASGLTLRRALRNWRFWTLGSATACIYLTVGGIIPNLVPAMTDKGFAPAAAAAVMGVFGVSIIFGRIVVGALLDRFWAPAVAAAILVPAAMACLIFQQSADLAIHWMAAAMLGIATGMEFDVLGFLTARYFGMADFPRIYGRLYIFVAAAAGVAPLLFGHLFDLTGSYDVALTVGAALLLLGGGLMLALGRYPDLVSDEGSSSSPPT